MYRISDGQTTSESGRFNQPDRATGSSNACNNASVVFGRAGFVCVRLYSRISSQGRPPDLFIWCVAGRRRITLAVLEFMKWEDEAVNSAGVM